MDTWTPAYINNRTSKPFNLIWNKPGVYLIRNSQTKRIVYIGMSQSNTYKALYRHFQKWNCAQYRVIFENRHNYEVRVIICDTPQQAIVTERRLIKRLNPSHNHEVYEDWEYTAQAAETCPF